MLGGVALAFGLVQLKDMGKADYIAADYTEFFAGHNERVIVYGTDWCKYCELTRKYLQAHQIDYVDMNVDKSPVARQQYERLGGGGVPMVLIGNRRISGYLPEVFDEARTALSKVQRR